MRFRGAAVLLLAVAACDETPGPGSDGGVVVPGDCDVPALFAASCTAGCHDATAVQGGLDLASPNLEARVYGQHSTGRADYLLVDPEIPEESALFLKLSMQPPFGASMPQGRPAFTLAQRACVLAWVQQVADGGVPDAGGVQPDAGLDDAGVMADGGVTMRDAGTFDAGRFWGPIADGSGCVPDGGAWCVAQRVNEPLYAVRGLSDSDIWAVGARGAAYHYDGTTWSRSDAGVGVTLFDVHPVSPNEVWAVGEQGVVLRFQPGGWSPVGWSPPASPLDAGLLPSGQPQRDLGGVWATSTEVWISGAGNTLARHAGSTLRVVQSDAINSVSPDLIKVWGRNDTEVWAAGDFAFREYDGAQWADGRGSILRVFGIWGSVNPMNGSRVLVAVGNDGSILAYNYTDPGSYPWQPPNFNADTYELKRDLRSVWLDGAARGWAVGLDGQLMELDLVNRRYVRHLTPVFDHLLGVWGTAVNRSWAVGGRVDGVILRSR